MAWQPEMDELRRRQEMTKRMGGADKVKRQHDGGRLTVRERIDRLVDKNSFREVGSVAGMAEYDGKNDLVNLTPANAVMGRANRFLAARATAIATGFPDLTLFDARLRDKLTHVGNPLRPMVIEAAKLSAPGFDDGVLRLLVTGGSQGAKAINSAVLDGLADMARTFPGLSITHQTGEADHARVAAAYRHAGVSAEVVPFLYDMPTVLRAADLVVARAGAMTIAELTACGKPAILIPLPTAIYDHQMKNARAMEAAGGAVVLPQPELTGAQLAGAVAALLQDSDRLRAMQEKSRAMSRIDAAEKIVHECYALMGVNHDIHRTVGATGV